MELEGVIDRVTLDMSYKSSKSKQMISLHNQDIFVLLPTGFGNNLCYCICVVTVGLP